MRHSFAALCSLGNELCSLGKRPQNVGSSRGRSGILGGRQNSTRFPASGMGARSNFCARLVAAALRRPAPCLEVWLLEFSLCKLQAALWRVCQSRVADWTLAR